MGHLFYITSSFVHHHKPLGEFKLELLSGNAQFGSKSAILLSCVTLLFDGWPWKTIGHLFYVASRFVHHFIAIGEFKLKLQSGNAPFGSKSAIYFPCDLEIWQMILKNNRAPLLCCFKLHASFHSHWWIQTKIRVRKRSIRVKIGNFFSHVTLKFDGLPWKTIWHLISSQCVNSNWSYGPETAKWGHDLCDLDLWHGHHFCHW